MRCERCGREIYKHDVCNYCGRKLCVDCVKSSKRKSKVVRLVICKDCWGAMSKRKIYKNSEVTVAQAVPQQ